MRVLASGLALGFALVACSSGPTEPAVVTSMARDALVPAIDSAAEAAESLSTAISAFCAAPSAAGHKAAQDAWDGAKYSWEASELTTFFGPADMLRTVSKVDYAPISEPGIDELLASDEVIDADYIDNRAASTQRGLGAIEYGLFRDLEDASGPRVCSLTTSASAVVASQADGLHRAWIVSFDGGAPYVETLTGSMTSNDALGMVVGAIVETLKRQSLFELGKGLGLSAPEPQIEAIPEGAAGAASMMYSAQLEGIRDLIDAGAPDSLGSLIRARSRDVADRIGKLLDDSLAGLAALDGPMRSVVLESPGEVVPIYESLSELRVLFESDVVSLLDVTLGFSDTDGDTG